MLLAFLAGFSVYRAASNEPSHIWRRLGKAKVTYNGQPCENCEVLRSLGGEIIVSVPERIPFFPGSVERCDYVIRPEISSAEATQNQLIRFGRFAWSIDAPVRSTPMIMAEGGGIDPQLIVNQNSVEFTSVLRKRIQAIW